MDENYQSYLNRVARLTLPATYESQVQHIQESPKFKSDSSGKREAVYFPGYSVLTPPWADDSHNAIFYQNLKVCQDQLLAQLNPGLMMSVPPESFHLTLADLIWDSAYKHASENPQFDEKLRSCIAEIFEQAKYSIASDKQICWQPLGFMLMPRALAVCLVSKDEESYDRIIKLRRAIYQNSGLIALGIEQQYRFTAHITLGYFGEIPSDFDRDRFSNMLSELNQQWLQEEPPEFWSHTAELRKFDSMTNYYRDPDWPTLEF